MATATQVLLKDVAGSLSFTVVEGTPSSASVVIYDENGAQAETPAVTTSGTTLSCAIDAGTVDRIADNYRARWTYTAGGVVYRRDQRFAVRAAVAYHTLSVDRFVSAYYPLLRERFPRGVSTFAPMITAAWEEITGLLRGRGLDIDRMIDCGPIEPALAAYAAYKIATNYGFGNDTTSEMQQWAQDRLAEYHRHLDAAIAAFPWYETGDDMVPTGADANLGRIRMSR
jgi:hypothetical protein